MRQIITTSLTLIFLMLAGAVSAGDCLRLCDDEFWKTQPTLDEVKAEVARGADLSKSDATETFLPAGSLTSEIFLIKAALRQPAFLADLP